MAIVGVRNQLVAGSVAGSPDGVVAEISGPEADAVLRALRQPLPEEVLPVPDLREAEYPPEPTAVQSSMQPPPAIPSLPVHLLPVEEDASSVLWKRKRNSAILVYSRNAGTTEPGVQATDSVGFPDVLGAGNGNDPQARSLAGRLQASSFDPVRAEVLGGLDSRILEGTVIACILETAISSAVPGMTLCRTRVSVYSEDGAFELIPAGSRVVGEYQGGVQSGQARIFVLWRRLITPDGVSVALASPGAGPLGRGGHEGYLDQKWNERFASALMVSLIADVDFGGSGSAANAAGAALRTTTNEVIQAALPAVPELVKLQGEPIAIIVARDLDFSEAMQRRIDLAGQRAGWMVFDRQ